jgi:SET domain-containing protein
MLLVKTKLGVSSVHGIGLFAAQFIPKGTATWEYHPEFDTSYSSEDIARMFPAPRQQVFKYSYFDKELGRYVLCFDDMRFINHSADAPNISATLRRDVAARDIQEGEELLCDYNCFDDEYFARLGIHKSELL